MKSEDRKLTDLLKSYVFFGKEIKKVKHSLYQVGTKKVLIYTRKMNTKTYFFGINPEYLEEAEEVILVCYNNECVYNIPANSIKEWGLTLHEKRGYLTTIEAEDSWNNSYLRIKKKESNSLINIDRFWMPLYEEIKINK